MTDRLQTLAYPGGTTANYTYFPNLQDKRLQEIKNQTSASVLLSQFDYTYDTEGQLLTWTKNYPGLPTPQRHDLGYDNADQLLTAPLKKTTNNALIRQYTYGYDPASNRTSERVGNATTNSVPNNVNEITSQSGATNRTLSYDLNGSLTSDGGTRTFEWDGANRLVAVNYTGTNQRTRIFLRRAQSLCEDRGKDGQHGELDAQVRALRDGEVRVSATTTARSSSSSSARGNTRAVPARITTRAIIWARSAK